MNAEERLNKITETIIGVAIGIHKALGPRLLESAYEACMVYDLIQSGLKSDCKVGLLINFNVEVLKDGIQRVVNNFPDSLRTLRPLR